MLLRYLGKFVEFAKSFDFLCSFYLDIFQILLIVQVEFFSKKTNRTCTIIRDTRGIEIEIKKKTHLILEVLCEN